MPESPYGLTVVRVPRKLKRKYPLSRIVIQIGA